MPRNLVEDHISGVTWDITSEMEHLRIVGQRQPSREERDEILAQDKECTRLWRSGACVQHKMEMCIRPVMFRARTGLPLASLEWPHYSYASKAIDPSSVAVRMCIAMDIDLMMSIGQSGHQAAANALVETAGAYIYRAASDYGAPSVFELSEGVASRLLDTEPPIGIGIKMPMRGLYIKIPRGLISSEDYARPGVYCDTTVIGIASTGNGDDLIVMTRSEADKSASSYGDDSCGYVIVKPNDQDRVPSYSSYATSGRSTRRVRGVNVFESSQNAIESTLALNFIAYLQSEQANVKPDGANRPWREVREILASNPKRTRVVIGKRYATWHAQDPVGTKPYELTATDILVRGHWRRQVHGEKRALRKLIWVEPFVRRATDAMPAGHDYVVAGAAE